MSNHGSNGVPARVNSRKTWIILGVVFIVAAVGWLLTSRNHAGTAEPKVDMINDKASSNGMAGMDMSLRGGGVRLTASQIREFGVTFDTLKLRPFQNQVRATASIVMDETRVAQITPKFNGFVERLFVNATGQTVRRGQPVAALYSPDVYAAKQELLLAARLNQPLESPIPGVALNSVSLLAAAKQRLRLWDVSDAEIDGILRKRQASRTVTLLSPVSGVVTEKNVVQGQSVMAGAPLMTVSDLSTVWAIAEFREADARSAQVGATALIEVNSFPGEPMSGRVSYVYPTLTEQARTIRARVVLSNPNGRLKPGMFATVLLSSSEGSSMSVPSPALIDTGDRTYVFVRMKDGSLMPHTVVTGRRASGLVEILSGADPGAIVVTSAQFLLDSESNIGEVMRSMIGQAGMAGSMNDKGADMKGMQMPPAAKR
ncbi:MAG: efflux RND transporter periplasmic adaptor subunit [Gemmatimonadaceae bacterium]